MKLAADSENGVYEVHYFFEGGTEMLDSLAFYEALPTLAPGRVIGCNVGGLLLETIDREYGVHYV